MINVDDRILDKVNESEFWLIMHIAKRFKEDDMKAWPSLKTLAKDAGWSENATRKWRDSLIAKGFLVCKPRSGSSNVYSLSKTGIGIFTGIDNKPLPESEPLPKNGIPNIGTPPLPNIGTTPLPNFGTQNTINKGIELTREQEEKKEYTQAEIDEAIKAFFTPNTEEPKSPPVPPPPPPVDTVTAAADIAIRFVQTNLATFQKWHEDQFAFMPETPQMTRNSIEAFFGYWQAAQEETGRAYKEPEKWFILKYRTWIATGNKLARKYEAEQQQRQRAASKPTQQRRASSGASQINDFR